MLRARDPYLAFARAVSPLRRCRAPHRGFTRWRRLRAVLTWVPMSPSTFRRDW